MDLEKERERNLACDFSDCTTINIDDYNNNKHGNINTEKEKFV